MPRGRSSRKRRTEAEWSEILRRFASSGLSQREFCRREGVALCSFQRWRRRLGSGSSTEFVELVPAETSPVEATPKWTLDVALPNGVCLRFRG